MLILIKALQTEAYSKSILRMWQYSTTLYMSAHLTFLLFLICILYVQAQKLPKANAVSVLQAPSLRIQPAPQAAAYDPKTADLRLYGTAHFDPSYQKRKKNTGKRYHFLEPDRQLASSPYGKIYDSNTKRYEASPSKISYEIKVYIPKHEPEYSPSPSPSYAPSNEDMPAPEYPTGYEERPVYSYGYAAPSPKYEQRVSYMKPYYTPEGKTMYEVRPGYSSGRPYRQPSYEMPVYKPMYEMEYRKPAYETEYKPPPPVYKQPSYEVHYKPAQPVYEEPQYSKQPTYEVAYKPAYREYEPPPPPPPPAYPPNYEPKSKPEGYSQTIPYDQQQTTYQMDNYRPKQEPYENKGGPYGYQKPPPQQYQPPPYQPPQQPDYQESPPSYYQPQQPQQYQPLSPPMQYQIQVSPPQPNYPSYGYGTYANYKK